MGKVEKECKFWVSCCYVEDMLLYGIGNNICWSFGKCDVWWGWWLGRIDEKIKEEEDGIKVVIGMFLFYFFLYKWYFLF